MNRHKRGDLSPCRKKRFWAYRGDVECWVSAKKYETMRQRDIFLRKVAYMSPDLLNEERKKPKTKTKTK